MCVKVVVRSPGFGWLMNVFELLAMLDISVVPEALWNVPVVSVQLPPLES